MKLIPISALFDAVEPRIVGAALAAMQEACSGTNLRKLREHARYTQEDLARKAGIAQASLSLLESGTNKPTIGTAFALWVALTAGAFGSRGEPTRAQAEILGCLAEWERFHGVSASAGKGDKDAALQLAKAKLALMELL